ncbi:MAG: hypothetical protein ACYSUD_12030, partial [Planctomycetota bacterium]
PQIYLPDGKKTKPIVVKTNLELLDYYRTLIALRKQRPELVYGKLQYILINDKAMTLAYRRSIADRETIIAFNRSGKSQIIPLSRNTDTMLKRSRGQAALQSTSKRAGKSASSWPRFPVSHWVLSNKPFPIQ